MRAGGPFNDTMFEQEALNRPVIASMDGNLAYLITSRKRLMLQKDFVDETQQGGQHESSSLRRA